MARSLISRKRDLLYFVFFCIHLPVMFAVDLVPLYPPNLVPQILRELQTHYTATYADRFFTHPPAFFPLYVFLELILHVPLSIWALRAIPRDSPYVPVVLLPYAVQTAVTTVTCVAELLSWSTHSWDQKKALLGLYLPYLLLALAMGVDMAARLVRMARQLDEAERQTKKR